MIGAYQIGMEDMPDHIPSDDDDDEYIPWDSDRDYPLGDEEE